MADGCHLENRFLGITQQWNFACWISCSAMGHISAFSKTYSCFPNAVWASASGGFRIVSDTVVLHVLQTDVILIDNEWRLLLCDWLKLEDITRAKAVDVERCRVTTRGGSDDLVYCVAVQFFDLVCLSLQGENASRKLAAGHCATKCRWSVASGEEPGIMWHGGISLDVRNLTLWVLAWIKWAAAKSRKVPAVWYRI